MNAFRYDLFFKHIIPSSRDTKVIFQSKSRILQKKFSYHYLNLTNSSLDRFKLQMVANITIQ